MKIGTQFPLRSLTLTKKRVWQIQPGSRCWPLKQTVLLFFSIIYALDNLFPMYIIFNYFRVHFKYNFLGAAMVMLSVTGERRSRSRPQAEFGRDRHACDLINETIYITDG